MNPDFWLQRWRDHQIAFHEKDGNKLMARHFDALAVSAGARFFLPLCGKTGDIAQLLRNGYRVAGVELAETAIRQLFDELGIRPLIRDAGELKRYSAEHLDIYVGDFFHLSAALLGPVDAVYDRAALVALPADMRPAYAAHLTTISGASRQMLITFEYDQSQMDGPPFSVDEGAVQALYGDRYRIGLVRRIEIPGGLMGRVEATENVWLLDAHPQGSNAYGIPVDGNRNSGP